MRTAIGAVVVLLLAATGAGAQLDPTVPIPPKVLSAFFPLIDLGGIASSSLPGAGRVFHTATTWTEDLEVGTVDNPAGALPPQARGFLLVAGGGALCANGVLQGLSSAVAYGPFVNALVTTFPSVQPGPMTSSRVLHTATLLVAPLPGSSLSSLLTDGRILLAGGQSNPGLENVLDSAEVYDPSTQTFTAVGKMTVPRVTHRAVRLLDGRILVVGGVTKNAADPACNTPTPPCSTAPSSCSGRALATAEIFDPATNAFAATGSMSTPRAIGHSATLLSDGRVLVAGGIANPAPSPANPTGALRVGVLEPALDTTEIYDPATGTFSSGPKMAAARANHTATRLFHVDAPSAICQSSASLCATASALFPSRVLMAGGSAQAGLNEIFAGVLRSAEVYSPSTSSFEPQGPMASPRTLHAAELQPYGKVLLTGGVDASGGSLRTAEVFNPGEGSNALNFLIAAGPGAFVTTNQPMAVARAGHTITLTPSVPGGTALVIGGAPGPTNSAETYVP